MTPAELTLLALDLALTAGATVALVRAGAWVARVERRRQ